MEPSKEAIAVRITRLNRQILGKLVGGNNNLKKTIDRESLLDALTVLYDECNDDPVKKCDALVKAFVDKYRSTLAELRRARVCISDFETIQTIGRGHFGEVHMVREKQTGDIYAMKTLLKEQAHRVGSPEDERDVLAAAAAAGSVWVPKLQYAFQDNSHLYLVMELCNGGDLAGLISRRNHPLSEKDAAFYIVEVAQALKYLHGLGYVHRDVKPHNIFLDRCGHVKLGDFGSCARLAGGPVSTTVGGTALYAAPELLAAAACADTHAGCLKACQGIHATAITACDYWSLGVVAFELVTLRRPFSSGEDDTTVDILGNIQKYENDPDAEPPFDPLPASPSCEWRALVRGLLRVTPNKRFSYLDTAHHPALRHHPAHNVRDLPPPWVPGGRGSEGAYFSPPSREPRPPVVAPFRARPPFAGQLPFVGYSYVAPDDSEDNSSGFNASHDCTAIDLATFKSTEKLSAMRAREIASLQSKLAAAEAAAAAEAERARRAADADAERQRARLQADITALSLQNRRLERQIEVEKEERMALERTNQELSINTSERNSSELRVAHANYKELELERDRQSENLRRLEAKVVELESEISRAHAAAESARAQQKHYKDIIEHAQHLRHRRLTEINVRALDSIAKERAFRRQTLNIDEESREAAARAAAAEARQREHAERRLADAEAEAASLRAERDDARRMVDMTQDSLAEKKHMVDTSSEQMKEMEAQLAQERNRVASLQAQVQALEKSAAESSRRETALEEQAARTEARLVARAEQAEQRASQATQDDQRYREKVSTLEQLVRQLEREVSALETRACAGCEARDRDSETESVGGTQLQAQLAVVKEQLERAEGQLQTRADEIASLKQETRAANLAKWRKEREYNELSIEAKSSAREVKRLEERLSISMEARKSADQKVLELQTEIATLRPKYEQASKQLERASEQLEKLKKTYETAQAEVDRSRNDIRKLKSELQYSEKRRMHAEEQEELSSRERAQLRDELTHLRVQSNDLVQNNKALQEACNLLEDQLTDLEKLSDLHEIKNKDLDTELHRIRTELDSCRSQLSEASRAAAERGASAAAATALSDEARDAVRHAHCQLQLLTERLESREARVSELEDKLSAAEGARSAAEAALTSAARRVRALQEEASAHRTRAHHHHSTALQLQASLAEVQEELAAAREAADAAAAWWRTRETKADATLRQQAKLIDFLQAKVEEAGRKKCSLSNKLFGRAGRRNNNSPPLRRTNRELREEVDRLRNKLGTFGLNGDVSYPCTPTSAMSRSNGYSATPTPIKAHTLNGYSGSHTPKLPRSRSYASATDVSVRGEDNYQIVWSDGSRTPATASFSEGLIRLSAAGRTYRARVSNRTAAAKLAAHEADRAFTVTIEDGDKGNEAVILCRSESARASLAARFPAAAPSMAYRPQTILAMTSPAVAALYVAPNVVAIGGPSGLQSLRGPITLQGPAHAPITGLAAAAGRALCVCAGATPGVWHAGLLAVTSALRRAPTLKPMLPLAMVNLPGGGTPHLITTLTGPSSEGPCAAVACGRRVFLLRYDAAAGEFKVARSLTADRAPPAVLLTPRALFVAGEKPLRLSLPSGVLETFAMDDPTVSAAARNRSPPTAILVIRSQPLEILLCYAECGVFLDESGKRTRNEDPKWSAAVKGWEFIYPFLYLIGEDRITIIYINDEAYRAPPCTCDSHSVASSSASEFFMPEIFNLKVENPALIGTSPKGVIICAKEEDMYDVFIVEGLAAFRSVGASVESLETISDPKGSTSDLGQSMTDIAQASDETTAQNISVESRDSIEIGSGFLADIRKRAKQLRMKNRKEQSPEDVIKEILTTEVGLKRTSSAGRRSPAMISEFDSDSEREAEDSDRQEETDGTKRTADICAEIFTRQVRFQ